MIWIGPTRDVGSMTPGTERRLKLTASMTVDSSHKIFSNEKPTETHKNGMPGQSGDEILPTWLVEDIVHPDGLHTKHVLVR